MLMTPATSSGSTASGIISCAVTHTIQPAAALMSHGSAAPTHSARTKASTAPKGSTSPEAAPAAKDCPRVRPLWVSGRLTAAPSGIFCKPIPRLSANAPLTASASPCSASAAASPTTMPSGRLCRVTASTMRPQCPGPPASSCPAASSSRKSPTAPKISPSAGGTHAALPCDRAMAGSNRLHTLAASMIPAAIPHKMRRVAGLVCLRSKNTPAAPSAVHAAGNSQTQSVKTIRFKPHSPFALCMHKRAKGCRLRNRPQCCRSCLHRSLRHRMQSYRCCPC